MHMEDSQVGEISYTLYTAYRYNERVYYGAYRSDAGSNRSNNAIHIATGAHIKAEKPTGYKQWL